MNQYTEDEILDMYFNRNEDAVTITANIYGCGLIRFAKRMIGSEDALECVNDTYLTAWRRIPPERPQKFQAWLYKVLRNIVCDRIDWNNADKRNSEGYAMLDELAECIPDNSASYEGTKSDLGRSISDFLSGTTKEKRVIFMRRYWYGLSIEELAKESGLTKSNIKTLLHRVRNELKEYLVKEGVYYG